MPYTALFMVSSIKPAPSHRPATTAGTDKSRKQNPDAKAFAPPRFHFRLPIPSYNPYQTICKHDIVRLSQIPASKQSALLSKTDRTHPALPHGANSHRCRTCGRKEGKTLSFPPAPFTLFKPFQPNQTVPSSP